MKPFDRIKSVERKTESRFAEVDILGEVSPRIKNPDSRLDAKRRELIAKREKELERLRDQEGYSEERLENTPALSFEDALELALIVNPEENQLSPKAKIAKDLRNDIIATKGEFLANPKNVRFFTTSGLPLDYHGIDAFFIINGIPVTLDASLDPNKIERLKADIYIPGDFPLENEDADGYMDWVEEMSGKIIKKYEEKLADLKDKKLDWKDLNNIRTLAKVFNLDNISELEEVKRLGIQKSA